MFPSQKQYHHLLNITAKNYQLFLAITMSEKQFP